MGRKCGDRELAERAAAGDRDAMVSLLERYYDRIYRMAWHWCRRTEIAEDIAQDVCLKLAMSIGSYRRKSAFSTWVWRITYNAAVDHHRITRRMCPTEPRRILALIDGPARGTQEDRLFANELWQEVHGLPPQQRDAVLLIYAQDMSHADAASIMGCTEKTVSWHLHQARKALRGRLVAAE
ncbi:MAG: RNA polymerase sigma factor [Hyphomicrobiaceae bacterium]